MRWRLLCLVLLSVVAVAPATAAQAKQVKISASIFAKSHSYVSQCAQCGPNGTPSQFDSCDFTVFLQVPIVPGATSYTVMLKDTILGDRTAVGPPFSDNTDGYTTPAGVHWFGLSGVGGAGHCEGEEGEIARYTIVKAFVTTDDKVRVAGTLSAADGKPVAGQKVAIAGPTRTTAKTDATGSYSAIVKAGSYKVTAPQGFCAEGAKTCTNVKALKVSGTSIANFARRTVQISGRVQQHRCTPQGCTFGPLSGVAITARGASAPQTATTDDQGMWSLKVPTGRWKVTPSLGGRRFDPPDQDVDARSDVDKVDFNTCAYDSSAPPGGARAAQSGGSGCDPDGIDWEMPQRLTGDSPRAWGKNDGLPPPTSIYPSDWRATLSLVKGDSRFFCPAGTRWTWKIVAPAGGARVLTTPKPGCGGEMKATRLGTYTVTATKQDYVKGAWKPALDSKGDPIRKIQKVVLKDWLIVGLGDSNGSGEGNSPFYLPRCNRSIASYQYLTAQDIEVTDDRSSVTFIHASCSGASIEHLWREGFEGVRAQYPRLPSQIEQVNELLKTPRFDKAPARTPDAVLVSAGVNNLEFGAVMVFCGNIGIAESGPFEPDDPPRTAPIPACQDLKVSPVSKTDQKWRTDEYVENRKGETVASRLARTLKALPAKYPALDRKLSAPISSGGLDSSGGTVFMASYPDFSRDNNQQTCDTDPRDPGPYAARFQKVTWAWLGRASELLNAAVKQGAATPDWTVVPTSPEFRKHGYCATDSYFRGVVDGGLKNDLVGAFHPDGRGHFLEYANTLPLVCRKLFGNPKCQSTKPPAPKR